MPESFLVRAALLVLAFPAFAVTTAAAQDPEHQPFVHEQWSVRDGLPVNSINMLIQGRDGYLWAATFDGLVRFDGVRFTVFNSGITPELPSNRIVALSTTRDGSLWISTEQRQLVRYHRGRFTRIGSADATHTRVYEDPRGTIWIASSRGIGRLEGEQYVPVKEGVIHGPASDLVERRDGSLWIGTAGRGLYRLLGDRAELVPTRTPLDTTTIRSLFEDSAGRLWIAGDAGVWIHDGAIRAPATADLDVLDTLPFAWRAPDRTNFVEVPVVRDAEGAIWFASGRWLYRNGRPVYPLPSRGRDPGAPVLVSSLIVDHEGSFWLGTRADGLHRVKPAILSVISTEEGLVDRNVYPVYQDSRGAIWVGSLDRGFSRIAADGRITNFGSTPSVAARTNSFEDDGEGRLRVATEHGIQTCRQATMHCTREESPLVAGVPVWALFRDSRGRLWAGTDVQAVYADSESGRWAPIAGWDVQAPVRAFAETRDGAIWMATNGAGLLRYAGGAVERIADPHRIAGPVLRSLRVDRDGALWIGTEGRGLVRLDPAGTEGSARTLGVVRQAHGLFDETIHEILEDDLDRFWMSSNRGIFWVPRGELVAVATGTARTVHATSYTERDGIRNREGNGGVQPAGVRARDGRLWFPTQDGVVVIDPRRVQRNRIAPPVVVERVVARDTMDLAGGDALRLQRGARDLQIDYTALSFLSSANVRFRYRLEPYDDEWIDPGTRRTAFYTRVPPGRFTFRVVASNNDGVWNEDGAQLELEVPAYLWETGVFRLSTTAVLLLLVAWMALAWRRRVEQRALALEQVVAERTAALRRNEQQLQAQNLQLAEMHEARSRLFTNLSHEFRTPLTLIIGPLRSLLDGRHGPLIPTAREQLELGVRNGQRLLRLINQILDLARLQSGGVTLERRPQDLVAFARSATMAFAPLAERRKVALLFRSHAAEAIVAFDGEQLEKVLLNLLSNAIKFTPAGGRVDVDVRASDTEVEITVRDSGIGIPSDKLPHVFDRFYQADSSATRRYEGTGIGLALARELVELHGGRITADSTPDQGSVFTVRLPLAGATAPQEGDAAVPDDKRTRDTVVHVSAEMAVPGVARDDRTSPREREREPDEDRTTVLVVDDNNDVRTYVRSVLSGSYRVLEAADGRAGLAVARDALPDVIVADVMMPGMDGLALSAALRDDAMTDAIPVVLLTARAGTEDQVAGYESGADAYLMKPFEPAVLLACVAGLLEQRRRLRERYRSGEAQVPEPEPERPSALDLRLRPLVRDRLLERDFGADALAAAAGLSYHQLYRALRAELRMSPSRYIRTVRAEVADEMLRDGAGSITEIAYAVGFDSLSYFGRAYRERFGVAPSARVKRPGAAPATV